MKNFSFLFSLLTAIVTVGLIVTLNACHGIQEANPVSADLLSNSRGVKFPPGTALRETEGWVGFHLPEGYVMKVTVKDRENTYVLSTLDGSVRCDCTSGTQECWPSKVGTTVSCNTKTTNPCTKCEMTVESSAAPDIFFSLDVYDYSVEFGDIADATPIKGASSNIEKTENLAAFANSDVIRPVYSYTKMIRMSWVTEEILKKQTVQDALKDIVQEFYLDGADITTMEDGVVPKGYRLVPLSIENHLALALIRNEAVSAYRLPALPSTLGETYWCSGSCSGGNCVLKKMGIPLKPDVYWCEGCNSGCSLHWES